MMSTASTVALASILCHLDLANLSVLSETEAMSQRLHISTWIQISWHDAIVEAL